MIAPTIADGRDVPVASPAGAVRLHFRPPDRLCSSRGDAQFVRSRGVWELLAPERRPSVLRWAQRYAAVRTSEGRTSDDPDYYRSLPFAPAGDANSEQWEHRAASYRETVGLISAWADNVGRPLTIADLGAGCCWLSARLAAHGHVLVAVDVNGDPGDGLAACRFYPEDFFVARAEFERLPLETGRVDLAIFNASFHYSSDQTATLAEAARALRPGGICMVVDSPVFAHRASGQRMVAGQQRELARRHGDVAPVDGPGFIHSRSFGARAGSVGLDIVNGCGSRRPATMPKAAFAALRLGREPARLEPLVLVRREVPLR